MEPKMAPEASFRLPKCLTPQEIALYGKACSYGASEASGVCSTFFKIMLSDGPDMLNRFPFSLRSGFGGTRGSLGASKIDDLKLFFNIFRSSFSTLLASFSDPMLGSSWELFRYFFALNMRSYLEVLLASIFDRFWTSLEPQKLSSRLHENHMLHFLHYLS